MKKIEEKLLPQFMGILNITPDSFSDGGKYYGLDNAIDHAAELISDGATILDVGGESTRPGAEPVPIETELKRVIPVIEKLKKIFPHITLSVDTMKHEVAEAAILSGVDIINDVSGLNYNESLADLASAHDKWLVIMHLKGTPKDMQDNPVYNDVVKEISDHLNDKVLFAKKKGVNKIILDPGIGFGKNLSHNLQIIANIEKFRELGHPLLLGFSRKSMFKQLFQLDNPFDRDIHTTFLHTLIFDKVEIIRVHNLKHLKIVKKLYESLYFNNF